MVMNPPSKVEYDEGPLTKAIEEQTLIPTDTFLWAAFASIIGALALRIMGRLHSSLFVGQWAPTFLILGVYHKLTKGLGSQHSSEEI